MPHHLKLSSIALSSLSTTTGAPCFLTTLLAALTLPWSLPPGALAAAWMSTRRPPSRDSIRLCISARSSSS